MGDMNDPVTYRRVGSVAHLELNRPDAANALDLGLARTLRAAVERADADPEVRAVVLSGAGQRFCAGGDVASFVEAEGIGPYLEELATQGDTAVQALEGLAKPVVAAVHGAVAGAGLALMLACDLIVAAPSTKFVFAYPSVGLSPDCGVSWLLPRAVGQQRALMFALSGRPLSAEKALEWGLVSEVHDAPLERGLEWAAGLAGESADGFGQARRLLRASWERDRSEVAADEIRTISTLGAGAPAQALIARFLSR